MKKKLTAIITVVVLLVAGFIYIDNTLELGLVHKIELMFDSEGPTIDTSQLRQRYLLDDDSPLDVTCTDNLDDTCEVNIIGDFVRDTLGTFTISLQASDASGNISEFEYTYQVVTNADGSMYIPLGYYDGIEDLEGDALKEALNLIVKDHVEFPYSSTNTDVWDILREADEDPNNPDNIIGIYTGLSIPKDCQQGMNLEGVNCQIDVNGVMDDVDWNREHIWSKSRGDFSDDRDTAHNDAHHLVAAERTMNSTKNNRFFEDCSDGDDSNIVERLFGNYTCNIWEFEPRDEVKGDIARMIFYMAIRYEDAELDLEVINDPDESKDLKLPEYGDLDDLLRWHLEDPVSEKEILRNEVIYSYQENRNPFIDMPELVALIWGSSEDYN